jgi:NitT/TauT family transport system ATP-binding protein
MANMNSAPADTQARANLSRPAIQFVAVEQRFTGRARPEVTALHEISFDIAEAEFCSIVGPSGCGKSTLLNMAAGLLHPTSGEVCASGRLIDSVNTEVGYVTQDSNLLPWLTVQQNIELPLSIMGFTKTDRTQLARDWIDLVGLHGFESSYPHQLSGGMQKRCAIARTLVYDPDVVLLDEPFGAVDAITRTVLQDVLLDLWSSKRKSVLFVTHDLNEAITLSDKVVVMTKRPGTVKAIVPIDLPRPRDVYEVSEDPHFATLHRQLWSLFKSEI